MSSFKVRDLTINMAGFSEGPGTECLNAASIHLTNALRLPHAACDNGTIACFNSASVHPPSAIELIAAVKCDGSTVACFNAASVHPPELIRAAVPTSAAPEDLEALKTALRDALARLESCAPSSSEAGPPKTLAQVEVLQRKLTDALADLNAQKRALGGK